LLLHVGIDDTDSPKGGCTTYLATVLIGKLNQLGVHFVDYPILLRLNPNAPWKTRGNGAICLRMEFNDKLESKIKKIIIDEVEAQSKFDCDNTNPGIVFHLGEIPEEIEFFSENVVQTIVTLEKAERLISKYCSSAIGYKNRRGINGALAAIGGTLKKDHTYELLTYRKRNFWGRKRLIDPESVKKMDQLQPLTFNNLDYETGQVLIAPRGPDPVLYGIRGETPETVYEGYKIVKALEPIDCWTIFRTNQGTDSHLQRIYKISELKSFNPATIYAKVSTIPKTIIGGHVIFSVVDETGHIDCSAYEPSGKFREIIRKLRPDDEIMLSGSVKQLESSLTVNLEKIKIEKIVNLTKVVNPKCPVCGSSTESMGKSQGLRCKKCGYKDKELVKRVEKVDRDLEIGVYLPPPRAERHLTKPLKRYGLEKIYVPKPLFMPWHS